MQRQISYRTGTSNDVHRIVMLHRTVFPESQLSTTIYSSPRVARYIGAVLSTPGAGTEHVFDTAWHNQRLVGYTHARGSGSTWHLNYIAVRRTYRAHGVGRELLGRWLREGHRRSMTSFSLDVDQRNTLASSWYERNGFIATRRRWVYEAETKSVSGAIVPLHVEGWAGAEAWQLAYGFSEFTVSSDHGVWLIGRLGPTYFRTTELLPDRVHRFLISMDPRRRLLLDLAAQHPHNHYRLLQVVHRMEFRRNSHSAA